LPASRRCRLDLAGSSVAFSNIVVANLYVLGQTGFRVVHVESAVREILLVVRDLGVLILALPVPVIGALDVAL